jgi:predicted HTH transcriptional regulator
VNELVLKVFDFAGVIESLGTGIKRMIETCRKEGLPDPTWEQNGSSFIVTIWKDMWTPARLREVGVTNRQMLAMPTLKTKHEMAVAEYMELTGVTRNTATADLVALAKAGIVKRIGAGRGATYILQKCTINAQNAQSSVNVAENVPLTAKNSRINEKNVKLKEGITGHGAANEGLNEGIKNEGIKFDVFRLILEKPGCRVPFLTKALSVSRATVERTVAALIIIGKIEHRGSKKTGGYYAVAGKGSDDGLV